MRHHILIVASDTHIQPELLANAVREAVARTSAEVTVVEVMIPAVVPPTLPITAWPPRLAARLGQLRDAADEVAARLQPRGRVEIVPCRSVGALLQAVWPVDTLVLVGGAGWSVRRAARGVAPDMVVVPSRPGAPRREPAPSSRPKAIPE
jgi:nucleotide-binding universal stress UspA family protein